MEKKIENMRCTVFADRIIPFANSTVNAIKQIFNKKDLTPILLQEINNVILYGSAFQSWGLLDEEVNFFQIHGNKIDIFSNSDFDDESAFCNFYSSIILKLKTTLNLNIRRLAFAPTYSFPESFVSNFIDNNFKTSKFGTSATQGFSLSRFFYRSETIEKYTYDINYNSNIVLEAVNPFPILDRTQIVIYQDINTKDRGRIFFTDEQIETFYKNVSNLNADYLKIFIGE